MSCWPWICSVTLSLWCTYLSFLSAGMTGLYHMLEFRYFSSEIVLYLWCFSCSILETHKLLLFSCCLAITIHDPIWWVVILKTAKWTFFSLILYFRLYQLLEGDNKKKEVFITHEHLEEVAEKLKQDLSLIQDQLEISTQEQFFFLSKLNNDVDMLCDALYHGGNQLLLCDQVSVYLRSLKCF